MMIGDRQMMTPKELIRWWDYLCITCVSIVNTKHVKVQSTFALSGNSCEKNSIYVIWTKIQDKIRIQVCFGGTEEGREELRP